MYMFAAVRAFELISFAVHWEKTADFKSSSTEATSNWVW